MADVMHTVGLVVYPNFQSLALAVASVFEYANLLRGEEVYQFGSCPSTAARSCRRRAFRSTPNRWPKRDMTR